MLRFPFGNMLSHDGIKARDTTFFLFQGERMPNEGLKELYVDELKDL